jgi:hypothetical protein
MCRLAASPRPIVSAVRLSRNVRCKACGAKRQLHHASEEARDETFSQRHPLNLKSGFGWPREACRFGAIPFVASLKRACGAVGLSRIPVPE